ncbi:MULTISPECIES: hypothetical protein [Micrococcaceae]|uniref:hypothetical protein n=1 Tax=Micrococcaceae TaxID=1268 RepID=UPI0022DE6B2C|nr:MULTISPECIES: hypothetical protein [Micrococcaceae]WBL18943.1 hypothetical protein O1A05_14525 [Citricoccus sp. NR2]
MADGITLALTPAERSAVAHELRRYGNYRREIGDDLWDSAITPEPGEPDPPGITPKVEQMVESHLAFAERCESLAAAFESDEPVVSLDRSAIDVIRMALEEGFIDEFPPEIARTAMLCRLESRSGSNTSEQNLGTTGEAVIIPAEPQPLATERFAVALAQRMDEVNTALSAQLAELRQNLEMLSKRVLAQQREIKQLREQNGNRRRSPSPFGALDASGPSRRGHRPGPGRAL